MVERMVVRLPLTPLMLLPTLPAVSLVRVARSSEVRISIRYVRVGERRKGEGEGEGGSEVVGNSRPGPGPGPGSVLLLAQAAPARVISDVRGVATFKLADGRQGSPKCVCAGCS